MADPITLAIAAGASQIATAAGFGTGTALAIGATTATVVVAGAGIGLSLAASALLAPDVSTPKPSDGQQEYQQPIPPRMFHYGRVKIAGPLAFFESDQDAGKAAKIILLSAREIDAIEQQWLDDRILTFDSLGNVTNAFNTSGANSFIKTYLGTDDQVADPTLIAQFPEIWTADHRLRGIAYAVAVFDDANAENQHEAFPNGIPNYKALIRTSKVWDPRDEGQAFLNPSTYLWTDNPVLCALDWLLHTDGYNLPLTQIHLTSFILKANMCDEIVPLAGGGSEKRYRVATTVYLNEPRKNVLLRLLDACDCRLYPTSDGKIGVRGGNWAEPTVTLSGDYPSVFIDVDFTNGVSALSRYNEMSVKYLSPDHGYSEVEGDVWVNQADIDEHGVLTQPLNLSQVPSHTQARRLAKIIMARDNPIWAGTIRTKALGLNAIAEQRVSLIWAELDGGVDDFNGPYWIDGNMAILEDITGTSISLRSADAGSFDWDETTEEGTLPAIPPPADAIFTEGVAPDPVTGLSASPFTSYVTLSWTAPADQEFAAARVWRATTTDFDDAVDVSGPIYMPLESDGDPAVTTMTHVDPVTPGTYHYWVTSENAIGDRGAPVGPVAATTLFLIIDDAGDRLLDDAGRRLAIEA